MPSALLAQHLAQRLLRSLARRTVYLPRSREEGDIGPYHRMLGLEDDIEKSAHAEWVGHLKTWDLSDPPQKAILTHVIENSFRNALYDVRRSFEDDAATAFPILKKFEEQFTPQDLLIPAVVEA